MDKYTKKIVYYGLYQITIMELKRRLRMEYANYSGLPLALATIFMKISRSVSCLTPSRRKRSKNYCWKAFGRRRIFTIVSIGWRKKSDKEEPLWRNYRWDLEWHSRKTPAQWNIFKTDQGKAGGNFGTHAYNSIPQ